MGTGYITAQFASLASHVADDLLWCVRTKLNPGLPSALLAQSEAEGHDLAGAQGGPRRSLNDCAREGLETLKPSGGLAV